MRRASKRNNCNANDVESRIAREESKFFLEDSFKKAQSRIMAEGQTQQTQISNRSLQTTNRNAIQNLDYSLRVLHRHYSRKMAGSPLTQSFDELNKTFHTMNLTQWMLFAKDMQLLNYDCQRSESNSSKIVLSEETREPRKETIEKYQAQEGNSNTLYLTHKPIEPLSASRSINVKTIKKEKLNLNFYKRVFQKYSKQFVLDFQRFSEAVDYIIKYILNRAQHLKVEDFNFLNLTSQQHFRQLAAKIGIFLPSTQAVFRNPLKSYYIGSQSKSLMNSRISKLNGFTIQLLSNSSEREQKLSNQGPYTTDNRKLKQVPIYKNRHQKQQAQILKQLSVNNLEKVKLSKDEQKHIWGLIGSGGQKSFQDRKKELNTSRQYQLLKQTTVAHKKNKGLIDRIDSRINGVIRKIR